LSRRELVVVLETLRGEFRVFGESLQSVRGQVDGLREDVDGLRKDVGDFRQEVGARFHRVEQDIGVLKLDVSLLKDASIETTQELKRLRLSVDKKKVDRDEVEAIVERAGRGQSSTST
jgi:regulator of replication initiation timing